VELEDKTALVTGAGQGIGRAIALRLAQEGASLIVNDAEAGRAASTAAEIEQAGGRALAYPADVSRPGQVQEMVAAGVERFGAIDILVNNAAIGGSSCLVKDIPPTIWEKVLAVNLSSVFHCCQALAPLMMKRRQGKIVNIASLAARRMSKLGGADYTATKWAVVGFSKHLAFELADFGVNVNVVCPGATLTPLVESRTSPEFRTQIAHQVPLGRWVRPEEQAEVVLFLVSQRAAMITGHVLDVDGGQLLGLAGDYQEDLARRNQVSADRIETFPEDQQGEDG